MLRVPLPIRGVAVLLLAAATVVGQTPEPPAELLSLDSFDQGPPDFLRQFSADARHPLLALMADGELASLDASATQDSSKLKPTPQSSAKAPKTGSSGGATVDGAEVDGGALDGCQEGCLFGGGSFASGCSMGQSFMPFACAPPPPQCCCRRCQRKCGHRHGGGCGYGAGAGYGWGGNPYLNGPSCGSLCFYGAPLVPGNQGCGHRRCGHRHCGGCANYGSSYGGGYGGGWNMMGGEGFFGEGGGFCGAWTPCMPPPTCGCRKCQRHHHNRCGGGGGGYGYGYGGGWGMGYGGYMEGGFCGCYMPQPCNCHRCRRHGCSSGYGYGGGYGCGCSRHHFGGRCHRGCQQPYYPMMMPCTGMMSGMGMMSDMGMMSGTGMMSGMGWESFGGDSSFGEGVAFDPMPSGTIN